MKTFKKKSKFPQLKPSYNSYLSSLDKSEYFVFYGRKKLYRVLIPYDGETRKMLVVHLKTNKQYSLRFYLSDDKQVLIYR